VVNLLSSPGTGKTALLEALAARSPSTLRLAALVGDLATDQDARRLQQAGLPAVQITTGQVCHLDAAMVHQALAQLEATGHPLAAVDLLLIENVGNLVCPASFSLGEDQRVVLLSVTEGEDKPLKYPATFHSSDLVVITKVDLAEAVGFDRALVHRSLQRVAPAAQVLETSARTGVGMDALLEALLG
jgi:hydrogenase nickel incorporation protein HypB